MPGHVWRCGTNRPNSGVHKNSSVHISSTRKAKPTRRKNQTEKTSGSERIRLRRSVECAAEVQEGREPLAVLLFQDQCGLAQNEGAMENPPDGPLEAPRMFLEIGD